MFGRFFMDPDFLADSDPGSGKKVGSRQKDPDPKHWLQIGMVRTARNKEGFTATNREGVHC